MEALVAPTADMAAVVRTTTEAIGGRLSRGRPRVAPPLRRSPRRYVRRSQHGRRRLHQLADRLDLSAVYHFPALPVVMTCVAAWLQAALMANDGSQRMVVIDES